MPAPVSGTSPRWTKFHPNRAFVEASRRSHCDVNSAPIPTAGPSTAQIVGFGHCTIGHHWSCSSALPRRPRDLTRDRREVGEVGAGTERAGHALMTTTAVDVSSPASPTASRKSPSIAYVIALRFAGRSIVIVPTLPLVSYRMNSAMERPYRADVDIGSEHRREHRLESSDDPVGAELVRTVNCERFGARLAADRPDSIRFANRQRKADRMQTKRWIRSAAKGCTAVLVAALVTVTGTEGPASAAAPPAPLVALTATNTLVRFDAATPGTVSAPLAISGLQPARAVVGIDVRPLTGELFAVGVTGTSGRVLRIDPATGAATAPGAVPFSVTLPVGATYSVDFNPTVDRIRFTQSGVGGINLRLNPNNGALAGTDTPVSGGSVIGAAYDRTVARNDRDHALRDQRRRRLALDDRRRQQRTVAERRRRHDQSDRSASRSMPATTIGFDIAPSPCAARQRLRGVPRRWHLQPVHGQPLDRRRNCSGNHRWPDDDRRSRGALDRRSVAADRAAPSTNALLRFDASNPSAVTGPVAITGLQAGETHRRRRRAPCDR